jgi:aminoglycoside phosphotransferase (APT) family kinase protein
VTVNQELAPRPRVGGRTRPDASSVAASCPQGPQACVVTLSPPSGSTTSTRRSLTAADDRFVISRPTCRQLAETALRPWTPVFIHGDLQVDHVFVAGDEVTGVVDWSEASQGDALFDLAILTLGHQEHLGDVVAGYGTDVDRDLIRAWWSLRCLTNVRWLAEHGYGSPEEFPEVAVLRSRP